MFRHACVSPQKEKVGVAQTLFQAPAPGGRRLVVEKASPADHHRVPVAVDLDHHTAVLGNRELMNVPLYEHIGQELSCLVACERLGRLSAQTGLVIQLEFLKPVDRPIPRAAVDDFVVVGAHQQQILERVALLVGLPRVIARPLGAGRLDVTYHPRDDTGVLVHERPLALTVSAAIARNGEKPLGRGNARTFCPCHAFISPNRPDLCRPTGRQFPIM